MVTGTKATDIKSLVCKYTGVGVNYKKTTKWHDGTAMTDAKCDGTIYRKAGTDYYVECDYLDGKPINPLRWGMKGDSVFDNSPIMEKILATPYRKKLEVHFPDGEYYFSRAINLKRKVRFSGNADGKINNTNYFSRLTFADGADGIIVNTHNSNGSYVIDNTVVGRADDSEFINLAIFQRGTTFSFTYYDFDTDNKRAIGASVNTGMNIGTEIKVLIANNVDSATGVHKSVATGKIEGYHNNVKLLVIDALSDNFTLGETVTWSGGGNGTIEHLVKDQAIIGVKTSFNPPSDKKITIAGSEYVILREIYGWYNVMVLNTTTTGEFPKVGVMMPLNANGIGFKLLAPAIISNCAVDRFRIMGICGFSLFNNLNACRINNVTVESAGLHGVYFKGSDSNAHSIIGLNVNSSGGVNIYEDSFLGNYYFGCHTSVHGLNAIKIDGFNNFSIFTGCYSEGWGDVYPLWNKGSIVASANARIFGGDHGSIFYPDESFGNFDEGRNFKRGYAVDLELDNGGGARQEHGMVLRTSGGDSHSPLTLSKIGLIGLRTALSFAKTSAVGEHVYKFTSAQLFGGSIGYEQQGLISMWMSEQNAGSYIEPRLISKLIDANAAQAPQVFPYVVGGNLVDIVIGHRGYNCKEVSVSAYGQFTGLVAKVELINGKAISVKIITPPSLQGSLINTSPVAQYHFSPLELYPETTDKSALGNNSKRWKEVHTNKLLLAGSELKKVATSADNANAPSSDYSQIEVQAILDELRDLKTKMRAAGLLAT